MLFVSRMLKQYGMKIKQYLKKTAILLLACLLLFGTACNKKIVLTTGFEEGELFKIDKAVCTRSEYLVYLINMQNMYENAYGDSIWEMNTRDGEPLEEGLKETVLARISRVKVMNLLAEKKKVTLSKDDEKRVKLAASQYYSTLSQSERDFFGLEEKDYENMYREYALANRVYGYLVKDINPEISDDEARTITVSHILIKTYSIDSSGNRVEYDESQRAEAYQKAEDVVNSLFQGEKFDTLVPKYNEDTKSQFMFRRGETDPVYEEAAFNLATDEVSGIVATSEGYYIIRCDNMLDRDETDQNKLNILNQKRNEAFEKEYNEFLGERTGNLNEELWATIHTAEDDTITTSEFFTIYGSTF